MILLMLLVAGPISAFCLTSALKSRFKLRLADQSQCTECGYLRAGLSPDARCPECSHELGKRPTSCSPIPRRVYWAVAPVAMLAPVLVGTFMPSVLPWSLLSWIIATVLVASPSGLADGTVPRRWVIALLLAGLLPTLAISIGSVVHCLQVHGGDTRAGEYGAEFDINITTVLFAPAAAALVGGWCVAIVAGIILVGKALADGDL